MATQSIFALDVNGIAAPKKTWKTNTMAREKNLRMEKNYILNEVLVDPSVV